jgi:hypothetical protein
MMNLIELTKIKKIKLLEQTYPTQKFDINKDSWINTKIKKELDLNYSGLDFYKITEEEKNKISEQLSLNFEEYYKDFIIEE